MTALAEAIGWPMVAIMSMTLVTYLTRSLGYWAMGHVPLTPFVRRTLEALPGAVVVAILAPAAVAGGVSSTAGLLTAALTRWYGLNEFVCILAGVGMAAGLRFIGY